MKLVAAWLSVWHVCTTNICHGFVSHVGTGSIAIIRSSSSFTTSTTTGILYGTSGDANSEEDEDMDVERERQRLESLLGSTGSSNSTTTDTTTTNKDKELDLSSLPMDEWNQQIRHPPLLTSIGRERMELEITLLESLAESDDAIPELWNLWYNARGASAAKELYQTESLVAQGQPAAWKQAEELLRHIIAKEGIHWVEPLNRLATLMFLQSRHEESQQLCQLVLALKPWHFGALSGLVMVQQGLQNPQGMVDAARQRMPPLPPAKGETPPSPPPGLEDLETRQQWVDRMLDCANARLLRQEMGLEESFADLDDKTKQTDSNLNNKEDTTTTTTTSPKEEDEEDAWQ
ncbi:repeat-containing protein [Seminavis robusta]|uniref:Repeat-containing protein n=1 Tax=Seminavis robusta TaxID=568900 RepID=A0A9N8HPW1_9STRA|nr:repeat-containing protein [Seminavis robusta]|eukprot:Sro934_g221810.1 repeat-containing protein (347) ;mRNA; f:3706-4746